MLCFGSTGLSKNAPKRDYSLEHSDSGKVFSAFTSISIIAAIFGNGILPEIQVRNVSKLFSSNIVWFVLEIFM